MLKKFFSKIDHLHLIDVVDIATGVPYEAGIPLTGFKYRCVLCGREYMLTTESGLKQIAEGHPVEKVLQWMEERPTKHAPDVVDSAASVSVSSASEVSASEVDSTPATTQVM